MSVESPRIGTPDRPLRVAIVGSGPAGFFTAEALLGRDDLAVRVDIFERLPTPFGLVREGVAPDHPSIKRVAEKFEKLAERPELRFLGNVTFGLDVSREELLAHYHQVVYAVGAQTDRQLHVPGEDLDGSWAATDFVRWYNGHPHCADLPFRLAHPRAVVVGNGNVAVDVTRILVSHRDRLATTDIADHALEVLCERGVEEVVMLGRRGPAQAKFTSQELKELGTLEDVEVRVDASELELDERSAALVDEHRLVRRNLEILRGFAGREPEGRPRRIVLRFLASPVEILGEEGRVTGVRIERNRLVPGADGEMRPEGTGRTELLECGLVLRSVGYRGVELPGVPFDDRRGVIPNDAGRVLDGPGGRHAGREYAVGWIKRGPTGIIGTNKADAVETVTAMVADLGHVEPGAVTHRELRELLEARGLDPVSFEDWRLLDAEERRRGAAVGRPRVKVVDVGEMLRIMGKTGATGAGDTREE